MHICYYKRRCCSKVFRYIQKTCGSYIGYYQLRKTICNSALKSYWAILMIHWYQLKRLYFIKHLHCCVVSNICKYCHLWILWIYFTCDLTMDTDILCSKEICNIFLFDFLFHMKHIYICLYNNLDKCNRNLIVVNYIYDFYKHLLK